MAKLTRTSRRLRKCTTRTSFLRTRGTGQLAPAGPYCTHAVGTRTRLGRAVRTARTVAPQVRGNTARTVAPQVRGNLDPLREMPPAYPPERAPCTYNQELLRKVLFLQPHIQEAVLDSFGVAFVAGALGALCWFLAAEGDEISPAVLKMASKFVEDILSNFQFFPAFLLLGLLTFIVNRWQVSPYPSPNPDPIETSS